jgi:hypothetical protein
MKLIQIDKKFYESKIHHLPFNRKFSVRNDLIEKMNLYGFTVPAILIRSNIFGKNQLFIADGQNRLATAMYLNITAQAVIVDYTSSNKEDIVQFVASLNSAQKNWRIDDYVHAFAFFGDKDYQFLLKIASKTPYSLSTVGILLYGYRSRGSVTDKIKNGEFKVNNFEDTDKSLKLAAKLSTYEKLTSRMLLAFHYVRSLSTFKEDVFTRQYKKNAKCVKELKLDDYTDIFSSWITNQ